MLYENTDVQVKSDGNKTAMLEELVDKHYDYLYQYAYRYFHSKEKAEDLVQDTFLAAVESISRFEGKSSYRTWLTAILRNKILDNLKVKYKEDAKEFDAGDEAQISKYFDQNEHWTAQAGPQVWGYSPDHTLNQKQFFDVLETCMSKLPSKVKQIFIMREIEGYGRDEISEHVNCTSSNVGVMLYRARIFLQQCLQINWFHNKAGEKL